MSPVPTHAGRDTDLTSKETYERGEAVIPLDRDFAAVVDATEYHVFLTGHDGRFELSVSWRRYVTALEAKVQSSMSYGSS